MHRPSVNKSFEKKLTGRLEKDYQTNLGSCTLEIVYNAFTKAITELSIDIDQFVCDLHFSLNIFPQEWKTIKTCKK